MNDRLLSRSVAVGDIHGATEVEIVADAEQRAALAKAYDLLSVGNLSARVTVRLEGGGFDVSGRVTADIEQACVVSLVPVAQHIDEPFSLRFVRPDSPEIPPEVKPHGEVVVDPAAPDPPEVLSGNAIDVGAVVEEAFVLAIDPYPRAPGAVLPKEADEDERASSPFAVLAGLKDRKS